MKLFELNLRGGEGTKSTPWLQVFLDEEVILSLDKKLNFPEGKPTQVFRKMLVNKIKTRQPVLKFYENGELLREYTIDKIQDFTRGLVSDFSELYLHLNVAIISTYAIQVDGVLSHKDMMIVNAYEEMLELQNRYKKLEDIPASEHECIRLEIFLLSEGSEKYEKIRGKGLFYKGLHFSGFITPSWVHLFCHCSSCKKSFGLQSFNAGMAWTAYFYCEKGIHTLTCPDGKLPDVSDKKKLEEFESKLPLCNECGTHFRYFNPLRCPHCSEPYIDFQKYPEQRTLERYGNYFPGDKIQEQE